jgi:hypothetical protein
MDCVVVIRVDDVKAVVVFTERRIAATKAAIQHDNSLCCHTMAL